MHHYFPQWKQHQVSLHAIFFGRPGTGKTTVCKIYGGLLKEAGVLSKGHVVVCNRATFVGPSWGDEENAIRQAMEAAKGGVLMIDEAYLLNSAHPNDPGNARFVVNLLEHIYLVHAKRCMQSKSAHDIKSFFSITPADIQPIEVSKEKKRIGF